MAYRALRAHFDGQNIQIDEASDLKLDDKLFVIVLNDQDELEESRGKRFKALADAWHTETDFLSSPTRRKSHKAYRKILSMGILAIPYILRDLNERGGDWYEALVDITGANPVTPGIQGNVPAMKKAWTEWGHQHGYDLR